MNKSLLYPHAPITEALFDIQVDLPKKITVANLEELCTAITKHYPTRYARKRFEERLEFRVGKKTTTEAIDLGIDGFLNWSINKDQVIQFRLDGFSFSRLKPYQGWDVHFPEVIANWGLYARKLSPVRIKRVSVRFINCIEIPSENPELDTYFVNFPQAPFESSVLNNFFNRMELSFPDFNAKGIVTYALAKQNNPIKLPIIFDLEVFREVSFNPDPEILSETFKTLRELKNHIFQKNLTQKTKDLFL